MSSVTIHRGDCLEVLPAIGAASIDLLLTDPPYNVSGGKKDIDRSKWTSKAARQRILQRDFGEWDKFTGDGFADFMAAWLTEAFRVLKPGATGYVFSILEDCGRIRQWAELVGFKWVMTVAWCKQNPAPQFVSAKQFAYAMEGIGMIRKPGSPATWNGNNTTPNWIMAPICQGAERTAHPTQKPMSILERLIQVSSNPGDVVLDPFLGSGSTAVAAKKLGRNAIGIERDKEYFSLAEVRTGLKVASDRDLILLRVTHEVSSDMPADGLFSEVQA